MDRTDISSAYVTNFMRSIEIYVSVSNNEMLMQACKFIEAEWVSYVQSGARGSDCKLMVPDSKTASKPHGV